ncbi:hypothetical protein [Streptomyces aureus]
MTGRASASDVVVIVAASTVLFAVVGWPFARLARAECLAPRWVREFPATARSAAVTAVLTATALLFLLTVRPEVSRA